MKMNYPQAKHIGATLPAQKAFAVKQIQKELYGTICYVPHLDNLRAELKKVYGKVSAPVLEEAVAEVELRITATYMNQ